ncbi:unnamed protein product [Mesocestoides corti]|uniref:U3 small nucleolar RNA-associated protein 15 homolog n=2 Tax=Mesocestoides corti TaxID=53468 RepID=A0A3P6I7S1_MESCO|nr:unnamed protein product [Mesocestoides corti]
MSPSWLDPTQTSSASFDEFANFDDSSPVAFQDNRRVTAMVVGLPNCGKSTLINALRCFTPTSTRRKSAVGVGRMAGLTRCVGGPVVIAHQHPIPSADGVTQECCTVRMIDTPGILEPKAQTLCGQLSLGVCGAVDWDAVDKTVNHKPPYKYAVPTGRSIVIYKASADTKHRRIAGFSNVVTSCHFRPDGKMLVGGEEGGYLRFCTTDRNKYHLRTFQAHEGDVIYADFLSDGLKAVSLGADGLAKVWDVSVGELHSQFRISQSGEPPSKMAVGKVDGNIFCTGDFKGTVAIYDLRQSKPTSTFSLRGPASALHLACDDKVLVAAADQYVYSWETPTGKPYLQSNLDVTDTTVHPGSYMHYKLVMGLTVIKCPDVHQDPLLLSIGMDKLLRITSLNTFQEFHQERLVSACTALGAFPDLCHVVVGCENGLVRTFAFTTPTQIFQKASQKTKKTLAVDEPFAVVDPSLKSLVSRFSGKWRGINLDEGDKNLTTDEWLSRSEKNRPRIAPKDWGFEGPRAPLIHESTTISCVPRSNKPREAAPVAQITSNLLRFHHSKALSDALHVRQNLRKRHSDLVNVPSYTYPVAVVRELCRRGTLTAAVSGQTKEQLNYLLRFLRQNVWLPPATPTCLLIFRVIKKVYSDSLLAESEEYAKLCKVLNCMWQNSQTVNALSAKMRAILYPEIAALEEAVVTTTTTSAKGQEPDTVTENENQVDSVKVTPSKRSSKRTVKNDKSRSISDHESSVLADVEAATTTTKKLQLEKATENENQVDAANVTPSKRSSKRTAKNDKSRSISDHESSVLADVEAATTTTKKPQQEKATENENQVDSANVTPSKRSSKRTAKTSVPTDVETATTQTKKTQPKTVTENENQVESAGAAPPKRPPKRSSITDKTEKSPALKKRRK